MKKTKDPPVYYGCFTELLISIWSHSQALCILLLHLFIKYVLFKNVSNSCYMSM